MTKLSIQHELTKVRPPRVKITYDVDDRGAQVKRELPFVMGVVGDFSGDPSQPLAKLRDRKFVEINRDNFNDVMARISPGLKLRVENTLQGDGSELALELKFRSMGDFEPASIVEQVKPLKALYEHRQKLTELISKVDLADDLESRLKELLQDEEKIKAAAGQILPGGGSRTDEPEDNNA